jgi:hypothetical protein
MRVLSGSIISWASEGNKKMLTSLSSTELKKLIAEVERCRDGFDFSYILMLPDDDDFLVVDAENIDATVTDLRRKYRSAKVRERLIVKATELVSYIWEDKEKPCSRVEIE